MSIGILASAGPAPLPGFLNSLTGPLDHYGYWTIALLLLLENIGVPVVPGEFAMIGGAIFAGRPSKPLLGAMGLGRGPDRFLLGGEVLLGQLGDPIADPDALHRIRAAAVSEPRISYRVVMPTRAIPVG